MTSLRNLDLGYGNYTTYRGTHGREVYPAVSITKESNKTTEEHESNKDIKESESLSKTFNKDNSKNHFQALNTKNERIEEYSSPALLLSPSAFLENTPNIASTNQFFPNLIPLPYQSATDCVTGFNRDWPLIETVWTPTNCRLGLFDVMVDDTCTCRSSEYDLNWNGECFGSIDSVFNAKKRKLEKEIEMLTARLDSLDDQLQECQKVKNFEMTSYEGILKTVCHLCCHVQRLQCELYAIKMQIFGLWQICNDTNCENVCPKMVIKHIMKIQVECDDIRNGAILKSCFLQMCRDGKQRLKNENHIIKSDIKKLTEIAKKYADEIKMITNETCAYPKPDCSPVTSLLSVTTPTSGTSSSVTTPQVTSSSVTITPTTTASVASPTTTTFTTTQPEAPGSGYTPIMSWSPMYRVSSRFSIEGSSTTVTPVTGDDMQDKNKRNNNNNNNSKGSSNVEHRHNSINNQPRKSQGGYRKFRSRGGQGRQSRGNGDITARKLQAIYKEANQLKTVDYSNLYRITSEANEIIATKSGSHESTGRPKPVSNQFPDYIEHERIEQPGKAIWHPAEVEFSKSNLLSNQLRDIEKNNPECLENFQLANQMFKKHKVAKSDLHADNSGLLRRLDENQQNCNELENDYFLASNKSSQNNESQNDIRHFAKRHQSAVTFSYIQRIEYLEAQLFNLTQHNEGNYKNYIDCRSKLEECHCLLQRCIDEMKKRPDEPDVRRPSETANTQSWINYSNVLLDIIYETKLSSIRNVFVSKLLKEERDTLKRELCHGFSGEPLQYQIDALQQENHNLCILIKECESANQQLTREKEETERMFENIQDKWKEYELQIKLLFGPDENCKPMEQYSNLTEEKEALNSELEEPKVKVNRLAGELKSFQQTRDNLKLEVEKYKTYQFEANLANKELDQASNYTLSRSLQYKQNEPLNSGISNSFGLQINQQASDIRQMQILDQALCHEIYSNIESTNPENENIAKEMQKINQSFDWIMRKLRKSTDEMAQEN